METVYVGHPASRKSSCKLFDVTRKLFKYQKEIQRVSIIDRQETSWKRMTLLNDRAVQLSTAKAYVFSESVKILWYSRDRMEREI